MHTCYAYDENGRIILWSPVEFYEDPSSCARQKLSEVSKRLVARYRQVPLMESWEGSGLDACIELLSILPPKLQLAGECACNRHPFAGCSKPKQVFVLRKVQIEKVTGGDEHMTEFPRIRDDRIGKRACCPAWSVYVLHGCKS